MGKKNRNRGNSKKSNQKGQGGRKGSGSSNNIKVPDTEAAVKDVPESNVQDAKPTADQATPAMENGAKVVTVDDAAKESPNRPRTSLNGGGEGLAAAIDLSPAKAASSPEKSSPKPSTAQERSPSPAKQASPAVVDKHKAIASEETSDIKETTVEEVTVQVDSADNTTDKAVQDAKNSPSPVKNTSPSPEPAVGTSRSASKSPSKSPSKAKSSTASPSKKYQEGIFGDPAMPQPKEIMPKTTATLKGRPIQISLSSVALEATKITASKRIGCTVGFGVADVRLPTLDLIGALGEGNHIHVYWAPIKKQKGDRVQRVVKHMTFELADQNEVDTWVKAIREAACGTAERNYLFLINPVSGQKKALKIFSKVRPALEASGCVKEVRETTAAGDATAWAEELDLTKFNGIVCCSGDGLVFEALQGLMKRPDWKEVVDSVVMGFLPGGSGNGLGASMGVFDADTAAYVVAKGRESRIDVTSVVDCDGKRSYSILSPITWALISDCDLGTEDIRWMGDTRFTYGALKRIMKGKRYHGKISFVPHPHVNEVKGGKYPICTGTGCSICRKQFTDSYDETGPTLQYINGGSKGQDEKVWEHIEDDEYLLAGWSNLSYLAADFKLAPYAHFADGTLDFGYVHRMSKSKMLTALGNADSGETVELEEVHYRKVIAFKLEPTTHGHLSMDGEHVPYGKVEGEVHPALVRILRL